MSRSSLFILLALLTMSATIWIQHKRIVTIKAERDRQISNNDALQSEVQRWQIDSTTMAVDVKSLRFTVDELERYRAEDLTKIEQMGVKIKNLESAAKHQLEIEATLQAPVRDTIIIREFEPVVAQSIKVETPHISLDGLIEDSTFTGTVKMPVTLRQAVWIEYKRRWLFWKKPIAVHQTITSDNPYAQIGYSEYINIQQ
ncbi:MAG: DUF6549 family protein [Rikenellaceae bacterium]